MLWTGALAPWLPALPVLILGIVAVAAARAAPAGLAAKRLRVARTALLGGLAVAATVWQARNAADQMAARLTEQDRSAALIKQVHALEDQINTLKQSTKERSIDADAATKLADYLRSFASRQLTVSCTPGDIEAYHYATQIVNILRSANWDARGPETTTIFGDIKSMSINVYDNSGGHSDTTKILLAGLAKFGISYQSRVPPSEALPKGEAVELFIATKASQPPEPAEPVR
jgi:hypothetical protein